MRYLLLLIPLLLLGCKTDMTKPSDKNTTKNDSGPFFSLTQLAQVEAKKMNLQQCKAFKTVKIKDSTESKQQSNIDWIKELRPIGMADINKTAWIAYFKVDTIPIIKGYSVKYTTQSTHIPIKFVEVQFDSLQQPLKVNILRSSKNIFFESSQKIEFLPGVGYTAEGIQNILFLNNQHFKIDSKFICTP